MSRIPSRQVPASPGALSPDARMLGSPSIYFPATTTPTAQPLPARVSPISMQSDHELSRAPSSSSTATSSAVSESSIASIKTSSTSYTNLSSFSSVGKRSPQAEFPASLGIEDNRPGPLPVQGASLSTTRFRQSDPGQEVRQPAQGLGRGLVARRQTLPSETAFAFGKSRPFQLSQPPRGHRNPLRGLASRTVWGREGLPARPSDPRGGLSSSPITASNVPHSSHHNSLEGHGYPGQPPSTLVHGHSGPLGALAPPRGLGPQPFVGALAPVSYGQELLHPSLPPVAPTMPNPLASSLARDALLTYAHNLYENPGPGTRPPLGLSSKPLSAIPPVQPTSTNPAQTYNTELLPLLISLRTLHPTHIPTALLLSCVQYALQDYEASLRTSNEILSMDPHSVEAMSNLATTLRAMGDLYGAEQWWMHAIQLRPSYWDAIENLVGVLCNTARPTDINVPPGANEPRFRQALTVCEYALQNLVPGPNVLSSLSTGSVGVGEVHRLQNLFYTAGNLKYLLAITSQDSLDIDREFAGIREQFSAVELVLNRRHKTDPEPLHICLTAYDLLLGLAVSALHVTGNLPHVPGLELNPVVDLLVQIHHSQSSVLRALAKNSVLPLVFVKPENIFAMMVHLLPSTKGLFPGIVDEGGDLDLDAMPSTLPNGSINASRMTATILLTLARHFQEAATRGSFIPNVASLGMLDGPGIRASLSAALLFYYCGLALFPSASVCNNLGILLSTLAGARITCLVSPPNNSATLEAEVEVLTGPSLARAYYAQGLNLDPYHPHLLTNMGSLLKDEGKLEEAIKLYTRALEIKPDFDVALANIANATKDAGHLIEALEYYKRAVLANPSFPESIVGLVNVLGSVCDWQGRGGLMSDVYLDHAGVIVARPEGDVDPRVPGFLDKLTEICESQIVSGYRASSGIIAADRTLDEWMAIIERCAGPLSKARRERWEKCMARFYGAFDRAEKCVYEAGSAVRLVEMLSRVLQRRWFVDMYGTAETRSTGKSREVHTSRYHRPRLPAAMVAPLALSVLPFHTFTLPLSTRRIRIISYRNAIRTSYLALNQDWLPDHVYEPPPPPDTSRMKIGYVSSDFNNHPLGHLMQSVFSMHDRVKFEIFCYATSVSDGSAYRAKIELEAHHFVDMSSWPTQAIVERIISDGIHILVNLNGYTKGARNDIFVVRPAPIVVSLMGFAGTLAAGWSDYIVTDLTACNPNSSALEMWRRRLKEGGETSRMQNSFSHIELECDFDIDPDPESTSEHWMFSEKFILMPHTCFVTDHKQSFREDDRLNEYALRGRTATPDLIWKLEEIRRHELRKTLFPDVPDDWVIYANFNQLYKVDPVMRFLLPRPTLPVAEPNILRCAQQWAGPEVASRIRFTDVASKEAHIQRCRVADLFLDTIECNAHTVATDVLWGGTPIVTWPRYEHKMCSRIAASIASATGYGRHMIVSSLNDYENRAVDLAKSVSFVAASDDRGGWYKQSRGTLAELRRNLYLSRDTMPLFDTARWTRNLERAFNEVWRRWEKGTEFEDSEEWCASEGDEKQSSCIYVREE
ncbi:glycosyltransferase family 41 protein [Ceratobasidium sp. AG-Ba]|nr:glycosyltransferase family 41 protein [Ceratobasidium sp. AG-Ba]